MYLLGEGIIITIDIINNYCENYNYYTQIEKL